ncbi:MAG TPA: DMT family transporter [Acidimicrobiales bacterium]|nr:DMT family transporter [Acidimicrobiales bacterium]
MSFLAYVLAVLAAGANATSNVLQRMANREEPPELSMSPRLIVDLVQRPVWLAGMVAVILSFALMAAALGMGQLAAIQPIAVLELPLTLVGAAKVFGAGLGKREWAAAAVMSAGLAGLIAFLSPAAGHHGRAPAADWLVASAATIALVIACVAASYTGPPARRPALLGVATGITFGLTAAYMKGMTAGYRHGIGGVFLSWQTYAMVAAGLVGMFLMQNALQAGRLIAAQPGITLADPPIAIVWGVFVFKESTKGGVFVVLAVLSGLAMAAGAAVLARSPLLEGESATEEPDMRQNGDEGERRAPTMGS